MGLRLDDCHRLRFEPAPDAHWVTLDARQPFITFCDVQKSGDTEDVPLTDAAVAWLQSLPDLEWIARGRGERGWHKTTNRTGRVVSAAGKHARILTKATGGKGGGPKFASLHDLRRTFATQLLASGMTVKQVQKRTRHADHNTLLGFYADAGHDEKTQIGGDLVGVHQH
jgi:integrase